MSPAIALYNLLINSTATNMNAIATDEALRDISGKEPPAEQRLTLYNVGWETYEKLLDAFGEHRAVHMTYD
jgi:hypothetical protein